MKIKILHQFLALFALLLFANIQGFAQTLTSVAASVSISTTPSNASICNGASATLTADTTVNTSHYARYLWGGGETTRAITVTPTQPQRIPLR